MGYGKFFVRVFQSGNLKCTSDSLVISPPHPPQKSSVTDMSEIANSMSNNEYIGCDFDGMSMWNTSAVTDMRSAFYGSDTNVDITSWCVDYSLHL